MANSVIGHCAFIVFVHGYNRSNFNLVSSQKSKHIRLALKNESTVCNHCNNNIYLEIIEMVIKILMICIFKNNTCIGIIFHCKNDGITLVLFIWKLYKLKSCFVNNWDKVYGHVWFTTWNWVFV